MIVPRWAVQWTIVIFVALAIIQLWRDEYRNALVSSLIAFLLAYLYGANGRNGAH